MRRARTQYAPLTSEEQEFAAENHYIVERFLRQRRLPASEWYDIVIFRYLLSVKKWFATPDLHRWTFPTIAKQDMRSAVGNEYRRRKRQIRTISLDSIVPGTEGLRIIDTITEDNLNFIVYMEEEDMNISYNIKIPERNRRRVGQKSDEVLALESFLETKKLRNMQIAYETADEAKKKLPSLQSYRRTKGLKEILEIFRVDTSIYVVRI